MAVQKELLGRLRGLLPAQFEEVLLRLEIDSSYLRGAGVSQAERVHDLLRLLGQQEGGLARLRRLLDDRNWFNDFLPEGVYPVGDKLREREEARESQAMEEAVARDENPKDYRITPEKFYTFRPEAAWLGVFRGWDAPRSFHSALLQRVINAGNGQNNCPAAAIRGPGGSGKSVALRRLALGLASRGYKVWWVEEAERLLRFGLSQLVNTGEAPCFLLIDEIQCLEDEYVRRLQQELQKNRFLILVVAGRSLPRAFRTRVTPDAGLFVPDEVGDCMSILEKIAQTIPAWADTARQLAAEPLRGARLIRILVILARRKAVPRNLQELETTFLEILADDISRIRSTMPGLAEAMIDVAALREVGAVISRETLIKLADYHQQGASIPTLLAEINENPRWQALAPFLSYDSERALVWFHHDELAEGLILAGQRGLLGSRVVGDDAWRRATLEIVINRGSAPSSSYALSGFIRNRPALISKERILEYIRQLLASRNGHSAYLAIIVDDVLPLEQQVRLDLLLAAAPIAPSNNMLWHAVWVWIQRHYQKREQRGEVLEQLHQAGCRASSLLIPLIKCLPLEKARILGKEWLAHLTTHPHVLCACLDLLGAKDEEAQSAAKRLLAETKNPGVLCACLGLLGEEAGPFAAEQIAVWTQRDPALLVRCFRVAGGTPQAEKAADEILTAWDKGVPAKLRVVALRAPFDTDARIQRALEVLNDWPRQYRPLVAAALTAFWNNPDAVTEHCRAILSRWHKEMFYRHKHHLPEYDGHIIKALSHPALREEARKAVQDMLSAEVKSPGFLSAELRKHVENIMQGEWPPWSASAEMMI